MKTVIMVVFALLLSACGPSIKDNPDIFITDYCKREELFQSCMKSLPAGPIATHYNDWNEVVEACGNQAYYGAQRKRKHVTEECGK